MAGYALRDDLPVEQRCPFATCYVHATVLDAKGKRMSKSAGNGIDPIDLVDEFGADAVRLSLVLLTREGQDVKLAPDRMEMGRRFTNKVWNAARFVLGHLAGPRTDVTAETAEELEDRWILSRLAGVTAEVTAALEEYRLNDAATALYRFVWNDFCDWYLELVKSRLAPAGVPDDEGDGARTARGVLARVLSDTLALLHPFTPFQTEVLWEALNDSLGRDAGMLIRHAWPASDGPTDLQAERDIAVVQDLVGAVRSIRAVSMVADKAPLAALVVAPDAETRAVLASSHERARALAFLEDLVVVEQGERPPSSAVSVAGGMEVFVTLGPEVDLERLRDTLARRAAKLEGALAGSEKKLTNEGFVRGADPEVVEAERARLSEGRTELELLRRNLAGL
jgi:valyl-tRNA synthetase